MKRAGKTNIGNMSADRIAGRVFLLLIVAAAAVFGAFYLFGFSVPYEENPNYNAPMFTDVLIGLAYTLVVLAVVLIGVSVVRDIKTRMGGDAVSTEFPRRIMYSTAGTSAVVLLITFLSGSSEPMEINGRMYDSAVWLKLSDMFINTSAVLMVIAVICVVFGLSGIVRGGRSSKNVNQCSGDVFEAGCPHSTLHPPPTYLLCCWCSFSSPPR